MSGFRQPGRGREAVTVAASVTLTNHDVGKTLLVTAAATVTMPNPATCNAGDDILIINTADSDLTVALDEKILTKNNAAADSVAYSTSSEKIGGAFLMVCTGTKWAALPLAEEAQTITVATD